MIEIAEAYQKLSELAEKARARHRQRAPLLIATTNAAGCVLAESVHCRYDAPAFDQSAMDGIAFAYQADLTQLEVCGTIAAGDPPDAYILKAGQCVRIMTGAPVPSSADTVVPVEQLIFSADDTSVQVNAQPEQGENVRKRGENLRQGQVLLPADTQVNAACIAALTAQGISQISVRPPVNVGILTTGNEVLDHRATLAPGQIHDSNGPAIGTLLSQPHIQWESLGRLPDDQDALAQLLASHTYLDIVILTGGVSMGNFDFVPGAAEAAGYQQVFHKVRIKPGKPLLVSQHDSGSVLFGLPGNPVSSLVSTQLFVLPFIQGVTSAHMQQPIKIELPLSEAAKGARFPYYIPVIWDQWQGQTAVKPVPISGSGDIVRFAQGQTLACLPATKMVAAGEKVQVLLLQTGCVG